MKTNKKAEEHLERDRFGIPWEENVFPPRPKRPSDYHLNEFELITDVDVMRDVAKYYYNSAKTDERAYNDLQKRFDKLDKFIKDNGFELQFIDGNYRLVKKKTDR
jgi:hypothetical protein